MAKLTAVAVRHAKLPGYYGAGGGLWLQVSKLGGKSWTFRFTSPVTGKPREMGLGPVIDVGLAEAGILADEARKKVRSGMDPIEARKAEKQAKRIEGAKDKTFAQCAAEYIAANKSGWKNPKHAAQWTATLETYAYPKIGELPVASIDTGFVLSVLQQPAKKGDTTAPLWEVKTETASRLRGRIESVLDFAEFRKYRPEGMNPARWKGHLDNELQARNKVQKVKHHAALPYTEIAEFMGGLREREGITARALEFAIQTVARSGEVRGATWAELDLARARWTIPAERMKAGKEHVVPLSPQAVQLLEALPRIEGNAYVFPAPRGGQLSDMSLTAVLRRMGHGDLTQHGFRSTFRDWAGETTAYPREVIEHALAHLLKDKAEAAYARGALLVKRSRLMEDWSNACTTQTVGANAIPIRRVAA